MALVHRSPMKSRYSASVCPRSTPVFAVCCIRSIHSSAASSLWWVRLTSQTYGLHPLGQVELRHPFSTAAFRAWAPGPPCCQEFTVSTSSHQT